MHSCADFFGVFTRNWGKLKETSGYRDLVDNPLRAGEKKVQKEKVIANENR